MELHRNQGASAEGKVGHLKLRQDPKSRAPLQKWLFTIRSTVALEGFHPQYRELHAELLARPFPVVTGQVMVSHRVILFSPDESTAHHSAVEALAVHPGVTAIPAKHGFQLLRLHGADLRIERHNEFTTFTMIAPQAGAPFAQSAMDILPAGWLDAVPGRTLAAVEIASEQIPVEEAGTARTMERVSEFFAQERLVGAWVVERVASAIA